MNFEHSDKVKKLQEQLIQFMEDLVIPSREEWNKQVQEQGYPPPLLDELKEKAKESGLWNLFLPDLKDDEPGTRLSNLEYAPLAEIMGRLSWASEIFNCSAPDTGNMEVLHKFGTDEQKERWLVPLLNGEIRSAFAMTEPDVASSDARNISTRIDRDGGDYVVNGRKWFISNAGDPRCKISVLMGVTNSDADQHSRHSMILIPMETPGIDVVREIPVFGQYHHETHCEVIYKDVRVPADHLIGEEGSGFAMAQARLGPGRIHHCMRSIGQASFALDMMAQRALDRRAFDKYLYEHGSVADWIALSRIEIEQIRLLCLKAAWLIDQYGSREARQEISMIKVAAARVQVDVANRAIQVFGAAGVQDEELVDTWTRGRCLQIADGPDEVHLRSVALREIKRAKRLRSQGVRWPYYELDQ